MPRRKRKKVDPLHIVVQAGEIDCDWIVLPNEQNKVGRQTARSIQYKIAQETKGKSPEESEAIADHICKMYRHVGEHFSHGRKIGFQSPPNGR